MRLRTGSGTTGARHDDWAMPALQPDDTPDGLEGGHDGGPAALLIRRHRHTGQIAFHRCWSPRPVPPPRLVHLATCRGRIEEDHQRARQPCGLDAGQAIRRRSWHRWSTMALLAYTLAYTLIAVATAHQRQPDGPLVEHLGEHLGPAAIAIPNCSANSAASSSPAHDGTGHTA
ncbi:hypothetical protein [Thermoactinospora rubra]|uniref:hypothetical protein n=1 Tax=Thermoactinospora rubra TaxID=1088767 RepID=UPI001180FC89|nr:hypothetical protein [Thermoactinospora rubra]